MRVVSCDDWEKRKFKLMKSVHTHKFEQNRDLRDKLVKTGMAPLLECTTDLFWGTGWVLDSPNWSEPLDYPGQNNLGKILELIRENYLPVTSLFDPIPTDAKHDRKYTSTPMVKTSCKSNKKRKNSQSTNPPAKQPVLQPTSSDTKELTCKSEAWWMLMCPPRRKKMLLPIMEYLEETWITCLKMSENCH